MSFSSAAQYQVASACWEWLILRHLVDEKKVYHFQKDNLHKQTKKNCQNKLNHQNLFGKMIVQFTPAQCSVPKIL